MPKKYKLKPFVGKRQINRRVKAALDQLQASRLLNVQSNNADNIVESASCSSAESMFVLDNSRLSQYGDSNSPNSSENCLSDNVPYVSYSVNQPTAAPLKSLTEKLQIWAASENVPHSSVTSLLHILHVYHPELPLDCRSLLKTPRSVKTKDLDNGKYIHFNMKECISNHLSKHQVNSSKISLSFNIDGLPIFHSTSQQFWPILCMIKNSCNQKPFVVGLFCGVSKPSPLETFLESFIHDLKDLLLNGLMHHTQFYDIEVHSFICDAPARAYIKRVKGHGGYSSCDRCTEYGTLVNKRVVLRHTNASKRTDTSFFNQEDEEHHLGVSPLTSLGIGMVSQFPLDYMHAACLGVMRKLLNSWVSGSLRVRLQSRLVNNLSQKLLSLQEFVPIEINRKPRSIKELAHWKATEYRTFLLYLGPVVLKDIVKVSVYEHFLLFHCSLVILCSPILCQQLGTNLAKQFLETFTSHSEKLYGLEFLSYNVHIVSHLSDDANRYGHLDNISAFGYENFLGQLKRLIRSSNNPLTQAYNRIIESNFVEDHEVSCKTISRLLYNHKLGPVLPAYKDFEQFKKFEGEKFILSVYQYSHANCYCLTNTNEVIQVHNLLNKKNEIFIIGKMFTKYDAAYTYPVDSKKFFHISFVHSLSELKVWNLTDIKSKCFVFPYTQHIFVCLPLLHTTV
ncbi:uncharacterized protein LOC116176145 isoform X1 [Photinus pyralis]|uniref:uncharacterized protein LOC116176145 isoform X1 n=1 Tax=Photinus pyralis TaxID=7054 RepID=UPI0012671557|nr:uncharacterized protein LOC116176145 isoform X1 [Photinus pyralis]